MSATQKNAKKAIGQRVTLNLPEAAKQLGISRGAAYAAAGRGEIPTVRIGKRLLVPRAALERLLGGIAAA
jgi:excisionase family DNA binding protein